MEALAERERGSAGDADAQSDDPPTNETQTDVARSDDPQTDVAQSLRP